MQKKIEKGIEYNSLYLLKGYLAQFLLFTQNVQGIVKIKGYKTMFM